MTQQLDYDNNDDIQEQLQEVTNGISDLFGEMLLKSDTTPEERIKLREQMNRVMNGELTVVEQAEMELRSERRRRNRKVFVGNLSELLNEITFVDGEFPETNWETDGDEGAWEHHSLHHLTENEIEAFAEIVGITDEIEFCDLTVFGEGSDYFWSFCVKLIGVDGNPYRHISSTLNSQPHPDNFYELANR